VVGPRWHWCQTESLMTGAIWDEVAEPWRKAFALAWESYQAGSPAVGAVVVGPDGEIVSSGRSRRGEAVGLPNQLSGSRLAHAEVNALAQLKVDQHAGHTLYVTLEPCLLCWAALSIARIPSVSFAGEDPMWRFLGELGSSHPILAERACLVTGPMQGPLGAWATLLPLMERLWRDPTGIRVDHYRQSVPSLVEVAERMVSNGTASRIADLTLDEAFGAVWTDIEALVDAEHR
jgi:tRNA(adenine34) deaminase